MFLPEGIAFARGHNRIAARRIDLRRAPTGDHSHVGVRADYSDTRNLGGVERKLSAIVLEQDDALLFNLLRNFETADHVDHTFYRRIIHHTGGEHGAQDAANVIIP